MPRPSTAGVLAALSCAAVLTLSACDTSEPAGGGGGSGHEGGHPAEHGGTHPSSEHRTTSPAPPRPSEFDPNRCPTGLVC
jgi:hypothetical protein